MLEGEQFLGIDGLVDGNEVGAEAGDFLGVFEPDDGEVGGGEAMFRGVLRGVGLTRDVVGPVDLGALARLAASCFSEMGFFWERGFFSDEDIGISFAPQLAVEGLESEIGVWSSLEREEILWAKSGDRGT